MVVMRVSRSGICLLFLYLWFCPVCSFVPFFCLSRIIRGLKDPPLILLYLGHQIPTILNINLSEHSV